MNGQDFIKMILIIIPRWFFKKKNFIFWKKLNFKYKARKYYYDKKLSKLLKYEQYYTNLVESNLKKSIIWKIEYDTSKDPYGLKDLSFDSFRNLFEKIKNDKFIFESYFKFNYASYNNSISCDQNCKKNHFCSIQFQKIQEFQTCVKK
jgi:hypothetical protein